MNESEGARKFFSGVFADADASTAATEKTDEREPFAVFDDLMCVVEALCPIWPPRELASGAEKYLL
jgi:hypothetical protein